MTKHAFDAELLEGLDDRTVLVTGATNGIGKETARLLAHTKCHLVLHGRNPAKMDQLINQLLPTAKAKLSTELADLGSLEETFRLARRVRENYPGLNLLINNAGTLLKAESKSPEGIELTFMINYLAPFVLSLELLPILEKNTHSRIVNLGSIGHVLIRVDPENLQSWGSHFGFIRYLRSKVLLMNFSRKLGRMLGQKPITLLSVHPGAIPTTNVNQAPLLKHFCLTSMQGAEVVVNAALNPVYEGFKGVYLSLYQVTKPAPQVRDEQFGEFLWQESLKLSGLKG
jgi:NAD(P)-dependent dehydrogenase (short-subunit alcohol dehydrogenase family)